MKKDNRKDSISEWQKQWEEATKNAITKVFFPIVEKRLAVNLHLSPNVTTIMTGYGKIIYYLHFFLNYRKSRVPIQTRHTSSRTFDIPVQKAKEERGIF